MAVCNKIGNFMRQSSGNISSFPSMLNIVRAMSSSKVFVGGLSYHVDNASLREAFSGFGDVNDEKARIVTERDTGRSKGFGFVTFADGESASAAVSGLDGQELNGRKIRVSFAEDRPPRNSYGDGRGGGYGGPGF